jgi:tetratricopeptide (TPR) repeat protein
LHPDPRPVEDLVALAQAGAGWQVDNVGGYSPWDAPQQRMAWWSLQARYAESGLAPTREEVLAWRRREAWEAMEAAATPYPAPNLEFYDVALFHLDRLLAATPDDSELLEWRGDAHAGLRRWSKAVDDYTRAIRQGVAGFEIYEKRGTANSESGRTEAAIDDFATAIEQGRPITYFSESWQVEGAIAGLSRLIEKDSRRAEWFTQRGWMNERLSRWTEALSDYDRAIALGRNDAGAWRDRGDAYFGLGRWEKAIADFTKAIEFKDDGYRINNLLNRGQAYAALGDYAQALPDFAAAWEQSDNRYRVSEGEWTLYQLVRLAAGEDDEFRASCLDMLESLADVNDPVVNATLAWTCCLLPDAVPDWTPVLEQAWRAALEAPDDPLALRALGAALVRTGSPREARAALVQSLNLSGDRDAAARLWLALVDARLSDVEAAAWEREQAAKDLEAASPSWDEQLQFEQLRREFDSFHADRNE